MKNKLKQLIPIEAIRERDTDLLLLEEIYCNPDFRKWILEQTNGLIEEEFKGVWHSFTQVDLGESDLAFIIKSSGRNILYLVENKIDAVFQPNQAERYRLRGSKSKEKGDCEDYVTILFAPKSYLKGNTEFDFTLPYESVKEWYDKSNSLGKRGSYKALILESAIKKWRRGYQSIENKSVTNFWDYYYEYVVENYSHLNMRNPKGGKPKKSSFVNFFPDNIDLNKGDKIMHKGYGAVDIQLKGKAHLINFIKQKYSGTLTDEMKIVKAGKSVSIRIEVSKVDFTKDFMEQIELIENALRKADELYNWALINL